MLRHSTPKPLTFKASVRPRKSSLPSPTQPQAPHIILPTQKHTWNTSNTPQSPPPASYSPRANSQRAERLEPQLSRARARYYASALGAPLLQFQGARYSAQLTFTHSLPPAECTYTHIYLYSRLAAAPRLLLLHRYSGACTASSSSVSLAPFGLSLRRPVRCLDLARNAPRPRAPDAVGYIKRVACPRLSGFPRSGWPVAAVGLCIAGRVVRRRHDWGLTFFRRRCSLIYSTREERAINWPLVKVILVKLKCRRYGWPNSVYIYLRWIKWYEEDFRLFYYFEGDVFFQSLFPQTLYYSPDFMRLPYMSNSSCNVGRGHSPSLDGWPIVNISTVSIHDSREFRFI